ncbi:DUF4433 domain-containing protein [Burkholderia sp. SRS-46]|nr:DUF4433 domain-containing protein [Burkholderia sp. SRS-46]
MQNFVATRGIANVVHFTRLSNLASIIANGIVPRSTLVAKNWLFEYNDAYRHDGYLNASCFTIGWPNYKMFYPIRCNNPDVDWAVIECSPAILWEKPCIFSAQNAASNAARLVPLEQRTGLPGITGIFAEIPGKPTRAEMGLHGSLPTNPQAEVLVCDIVEPRYFVRVHVEDWASRNKLAAEYHPLPFTTGWEGPRSDHHHWK